jgi:cysteine-rich repeat protein
MAFTFAACSDDPPDDPPVDSGPVIKSFAADQTMIARGQSVTVSWNVEKANTITIVATPGGTLVDASTTLVGSMSSGALTADTVFKITATGDGGKTKEQMFTVTIDEAALAILSFVAAPNPAPRGGTTELRWMTTGANRVVIKDGATVVYTAMANEVNQGFTVSPTLTNPTYTFTLEATSATDETVTETVTVTAEAAPAITTFTVSPVTFTGASQVVTVTYAVTDASTLKLLLNGTEMTGVLPNTTSGTAMVTISTTTRFELVASSGGGEVREEALVVKTVPEAEPNDTFMTATDLPSGAALAELADADDVDFYKFSVGAMGNVFASIKNPDGSCPFFGYLTLHGPDGAELGSAFPPFDGTDDCPNIDPANPNMGFAGGLAAGDYYVSVNGLGEFGPYTLIVLVGGPGCGNSVLEMTELCDDGNTANGDNCSSTCQIETVQTINPPGGNVTLNLGPFVANTTADVRWIKVVLTEAGQSIEVTTGDVGGGCTIDTFLVLIDVANRLGFNSDSDGMGGPCSAFNFPETAFAVGLDAGEYLVGVFNDDMAANATVFVNVTIHNPACGNTAIEGTEQCDDGNTTSGDGCSGTCTVEPVGTVSGPPGDMTFNNAIDPANQGDIYTVTLTAPGYISAQTFAPTAPTCTPTTTDTVIDLLDSNFDRLDGNDDADGVRCSNLQPSIGDELPAGTYYVRVSSFVTASGPTVIAAYSIRIQTFGVGCGNTIVETNEACDDGNTTAGDGCNATCQVEPLGTVMGPPGDQTFMNELDPASEQDFFRVTLTAPGYIEAETFAPMSPTCTPTSTDTLLALLEDDFTTIVTHDDNEDNRCSRIQPTSAELLPAGNYWVRVSGFGTAIPQYAVRIRALAQGCGNGISETGETCDDGNTMSGDGCSAACAFEGMVTAESEPNNDIAAADASGATRNNTRIVSGAITPIGDIDVYSFTITGSPASVTAQTHTVPGDVNACTGIDTYVYLFDAAGIELDSDDDVLFPTNACSFIDGIGGGNPGAIDLAPGTYYLEVHHYDDTEEIPAYFMSIRFQ